MINIKCIVSAYPRECVTARKSIHHLGVQNWGKRLCFWMCLQILVWIWWTDHGKMWKNADLQSVCPPRKYMLSALLSYLLKSGNEYFNIIKTEIFKKNKKSWPAYSILVQPITPLQQLIVLGLFANITSPKMVISLLSKQLNINFILLYSMLYAIYDSNKHFEERVSVYGSSLHSVSSCIRTNCISYAIIWSVRSGPFQFLRGHNWLHFTYRL